MGASDEPFVAYLADEVGQAYLRRGEYIVKTMLEPIFAIRDDDLTPAGFRAFSGYFHVHRQAEGPERLDAEPAFEVACNLAHIRNFSLVQEQDDAMLLLAFRLLPETGFRAFLQLLEKEAAASELDPARIVCEQAMHGTRVLDDVEAEAGMLRERGLRVCIGGLGGADLAPATVERLKPDIVRLDAGWLRRVAAIRQGRALLSSLTRCVRSCGISVMADEIAEEADLALAREIGVDLLAGPALARPFVAGADPGHQPGPGGGIQPANVVRLHG
jgi:EAL domain-containing protein (putative c-di-GMP-specific phosphodiesterase class I)